MIKINKRPLTNKQREAILNDKNIINLKWELSQKQIDKKRKFRKFELWLNKFIKYFYSIAFILILLGLILIGLLKCSTAIFASENEVIINDEFTYYQVDNYKDLARAKRIETCYRTNPEASKELITHCATMNTLVTWIESKGMQSDRCKNDMNCKWLKGWQNWRYWFMKFNSYYEENLYFAEKFWKYHYKKNLFIFVYWFKQKDWSYRYGWTATQQDTYLFYLNQNYYKIYSEIDLLLTN